MSRAALQNVLKDLLIDVDVDVIYQAWVAKMQEAEGGSMIVFLKKHKGKTLGEVAIEDPQYLEYIVTNDWIAENAANLRLAAAPFYVAYRKGKVSNANERADALIREAFPHFKGHAQDENMSGSKRYKLDEYRMDE